MDRLQQQYSKPQTYEDLVIEDAFARILSLEQDVVTYRDLLNRALAHAYELNVEIKRQKKHIDRLVDENRRLRSTHHQTRAA